MSQRNGQAGFTLIELMVVALVLGLLITLSVPNLLGVVRRRALLGSAEQVELMMTKGRYEAIRRNQPIRVTVSVDDGEIFVDQDADGVLDPVETQFGIVRLPSKVSFGGPAGDDTQVVGFPGGGGIYAIDFTPAGATATVGGIRIRDAASTNFLEVRVTEQATARTALRKWNGSAWKERSEGGSEWSWN